MLSSSLLGPESLVLGRSQIAFQLSFSRLSFLVMDFGVDLSVPRQL